MFFTKFNHVLGQATKELTSALKETPEYKEFIKSRDDFNNDEEANKLLSDFQNTQQTYEIFDQGVFSGADNQKGRLRELQRRVQQNRKISNLITSQQELENFLAEFVKDISQKINFPFTPPQRSGGGC